jgi:Tol biopolymer transport system component
MLSAGWLGSSLMRQAFGEAGAPWFACTVTAEAGCVRSVAVDATRFLDQPAGSADGRRVAAVALPAAPGDASAASGPIALFDAASGRRLRDLTAGADASPAFSPDGRTVAFVRGRDLYTVPVRGGRARRLARGVESPAWALR